MNSKLNDPQAGAPNPKLKVIWSVTVIILLLLGLNGLISGCSKDKGSSPVATNNPPNIQELTANPPEIDLGGTTIITVKAVDEDGDELSYSWTVNGEILPGAGVSISWQAPSFDFGSYQIAVTVSDGQDKVSSVVTVTVGKPAGLSLRLEPGLKQVKVGENFDLEVRVDEVEDLAAISFRLYFEPVIEVTGVAWGDFWDTQPILPLKNFEQPGMVIVAGGIAQPHNGEKISKDGSWGLAKITFFARTEGTTWLTFYRDTLALYNPFSKPVSGFDKNTLPLGQTQVIVSRW
ncbi:MAG: hypothetical protein AB1797_00180 [bacterium]